MRVYIRKTEIHDCDDILQWRNDPVTRSQSFQSKLISDSNHRVWFDQMLIDSKQHAYVGFGDSEKTKIGFRKRVGWVACVKDGPLPPGVVFLE